MRLICGPLVTCRGGIANGPKPLSRLLISRHIHLGLSEGRGVDFKPLALLKFCNICGYRAGAKSSKEDFRRATHENLANGFEMRISGLYLL